MLWLLASFHRQDSRDTYPFTSPSFTVRIENFPSLTFSPESEDKISYTPYLVATKYEDDYSVVFKSFFTCILFE